MSKYRPLYGGTDGYKIAITFTNEQFRFLNKLAREKDISFNEMVRKVVNFTMKQIGVKS